MNTLPIGQAASQWGDSGAGAGLGTGANAGPAHPFMVGAVGFGPAWTIEDSMAASIVRLEQELEEANARIAVLEEEQKILARGLTIPAKAAVIEGGTGYPGAERPEPSPHFCPSCGVAWAAHLGIAGTCEALRRAVAERDEARFAARAGMTSEEMREDFLAKWRRDT